MFKNILPSSKRPVSSDFTMITALASDSAAVQPVDGSNGKENNSTLGATRPPPVPISKIGVNGISNGIGNINIGSMASVGAGRNVLTSKGAVGFEKEKEKEKEKKKKFGQRVKDQSQLFDGPGTNQAFDKLLDDLQIPDTLRPKLAGMDATVKAAMLKSSAKISNLTISQKAPTGPSILDSSLFAPLPTHILLPENPNKRRTIRKSRSTDSIPSPMRLGASSPCGNPNANESGISSVFDGPHTADVYTNGSTPFITALALGPDPVQASETRGKTGGTGIYHSRGSSFDIPKLKISRSQVNLVSPSVMDLNTIGSNSGLCSGKERDKEKEKEKERKQKETTVVTSAAKAWTPVRFASLLAGTSSMILDVEVIKKLRLMLRNESASWSQEFVAQGGYSALLTRLNELLEVEWREEQHDDQVLHELLRCFKALSTSAIGCFALRSSCPTPFVQLTSLLYSDKRPGDVASRQLITELLLILFDLYPPSALPASSSSSYRRREIWESEANTSPNIITLPGRHKNLFSFIRSILLTPAPPPADAPATQVSPHGFIEDLHRPRIYKNFLQELMFVCRDYFWVFCHPNNTIWVLKETDEVRVEKPRAPGGMTGGVEFEAMSYFTTHMKFINAVARCAADLSQPRDSELSAWRFHCDLFLSGLERILLISRKASTTFYPTLHLELARYIEHANRAGYDLPWTISRLIGLPPTNLRKPVPEPQEISQQHYQHNRHKSGAAGFPQVAPILTRSGNLSTGSDSNPLSGRSTPIGPRSVSPQKRSAQVQGPRGPPLLPPTKKHDPLRLP